MIACNVVHTQSVPGEYAKWPFLDFLLFDVIAGGGRLPAQRGRKNHMLPTQMLNRAY